MSVSVGDKVLLPEFGGTKIHLDDKVSIIQLQSLCLCFSSITVLFLLICAVFLTGSSHLQR